MNGDAVVSCVDLALRSALFCCSVVVRSSSALSTPLRTADLHAPRFSARLSHVSKSIPAPFKSRLHESLYLREGRPRDLAPYASSPYSRSFGMRLPSMRRTCPSQFSRRWARRAKMGGSPASSSTSVLGTKSCQRMPMMRRRQRR